jgi:CheY-like chemotaxis protein
MARVLVVDDSEDLQDLLQIALTEEGFEVSRAFDGKRGLELSSELRPDVILLDMMMPEMDGLAFLSALAARPSPPPVVAQSGFHKLRSEALRRGAHSFLAKPFSTATLVGSLRAAIDRRPVGPELVAENEKEVERARQLAQEESVRTIARLGALDDPGIREGMRRVTRWLTSYFGFGTAMVILLNGDALRIEAIDGARMSLHEGTRVSRQDVYCDEVIGAGSTIVLIDPARHPSEHIASHKQAQGAWRFYAGVPLRVPNGPTIGTVCIVETIPREFRGEDMRVLDAMARALGRALETHEWPIDVDGAARLQSVGLFIDCAAARVARDRGAAVAMIAQPCTPVPQAQGLAVFHLDDRRMLLLWSGIAGAWSTPTTVRGHVLAEADLSGVHDAATARETLRAWIGTNDSAERP